jgi:hypothetical protein
LLWHIESAGWNVLAFEAIDGHHADFWRAFYSSFSVIQRCQAISAGSGQMPSVMTTSWIASQYGLIAPWHSYLSRKRTSAGTPVSSASSRAAAAS